MNARERLAETLKNPGLVGCDADETHELLDDFAHELAEQQRAWAREHGMDLHNEDIVTTADVINWIDPRVGPVSSEEKSG